MKLDPQSLADVANLFRVLAEQTRLSLLQELKSRPLTVGTLVERLDAKQANISKQLGILFEAGIVSRERKGNEVAYSIADPLVFELCELVCGKLQRDASQQAARFRRLGVKR